MIKLDIFSFSVVLSVCFAVCVYCQGQPDLGPSEPTFETCETMVCPENSKCVDEMGYVSCICNPGKTGINCTLDDPCLQRKTNCPEGSLCFGDCDPNVICEGATGFAHCRGCVAGWTGMHCEEDIDECANEINPCLNGGKCINIKADFKCKCEGGWTGKVCDCEKGTACYMEEMEEARKDKDGHSDGTHLVSSVALSIVSVLLHVTRAIYT